MNAFQSLDWVERLSDVGIHRPGESSDYVSIPRLG